MHIYFLLIGGGILILGLGLFVMEPFHKVPLSLVIIGTIISALSWMFSKDSNSGKTATNVAWDNLDAPISNDNLDSRAHSLPSNVLYETELQVELSDEALGDEILAEICAKSQLSPLEKEILEVDSRRRDVGSSLFNHMSTSTETTAALLGTPQHRIPELISKLEAENTALQTKFEALITRYILEQGDDDPDNETEI